MEDPIFEQYTITVKNDNGRYSVLFEPDDSSKEAFNDKRKIYVVSSGNEVFYVGEAKTSIKTRFKRGCSAFSHSNKTGHSKKGYRGYQWLCTGKPLTLSVAVFHDSDIKREAIEAIEAEIVYLVRNRKESWPKFQNEIHFNNNNDLVVKAQAESIYDKSIK